MVNHNNNNLFQQYTPKENKHFQSELQSNGKAKAQLESPSYIGKGASDYKKGSKHHISRKLSAILISIGVVIIALVILGATVSYHRDAPSTTSPNTVQQPAHEKIKNKVRHKKNKIFHKHAKISKTPKSKNNIIQVTNNHAKVAPKQKQEKSKSSNTSKSSILKPIKPNNIKKSINTQSKSSLSNKTFNEQSNKNKGSNSQKASINSRT